jgi:hypothetical protein
MRRLERANPYREKAAAIAANSQFIAARIGKMGGFIREVSQ